MVLSVAAEQARATLLPTVREVPLHSLLRHCTEIQQRLTAEVDATTEPSDLDVTLVEVKDVEPPDTTRRSMADPAEAGQPLLASGDGSAAADPVPAGT